MTQNTSLHFRCRGANTPRVHVCIFYSHLGVENDPKSTGRSELSSTKEDSSFRRWPWTIKKLSDIPRCSSFLVFLILNIVVNLKCGSAKHIWKWSTVPMCIISQSICNLYRISVQHTQLDWRLPNTALIVDRWEQQQKKLNLLNTFEVQH